MEQTHFAGRGIIVIGGACVDVKAHAAAPITFGTSNPGRTAVSFGGVARNVAENLARLAVPVELIAAIGNDESGHQLIAYCESLGVNCSLMLRSDEPTGLYTAILSPEGELVIAVAAMGIEDRLDASEIEARAEHLAKARCLVADANLPADALLAIASIAATHRIPLVIEPVSVAKAVRLRELINARLPIRLMTPNRDELSILAGMTVTSDADLATACKRLHDGGAEALIVGLGSRGAFVSSCRSQTFVAARAPVVVDVTGAGDAALAAALWKLERRDDLLAAARVGQIAAGLTVASHSTVSQAISAHHLDHCIDIQSGTDGP